MKKTLLLSLLIFIIQLPLILFAQNVGIGTSTPSEKLDVNGNSIIRGSISAENNKAILYPKGGYLYDGTSSHSKYIVIWLPNNTSIRSMLNIKAKFYKYTNEQAAEIFLSGYTYPPNPGWINTSFSSEGYTAINSADFIVSSTGRFGIVLTNNGSVIPLSYSHFVIESIDLGYGDTYYDDLKEGWEVQFASSYPTFIAKATRTSTLQASGDLRVGNLGAGVLSSDANGNITSGNINWSSISGIPGDRWTGPNNTTGDIGRTGKVGIGTTSPAYDIDVVGSVRARTNLYVGTGGGYFYNDNGSRIRTDQDFYTNNSNTYLYGDNTYLGNSSGDNIHMRANNFRWTGGAGGIINSSGNVGIGTSSPTEKLHVAGEVLVDGGWVRVTGSKGLYFQSYGGGWYMSDATWIRSYGNKSIYHNTGTMRTDGTFQVGNGGSTLNVPNGGDFAYRSNVLFANTSGRVGIGTTSIPSDVALEVNGAIGTSRMGVGGTYNSTEVQGIWSIAPNYKISTANNDFGTQYGMVYAHTNAGTSGSKKPIAGWGHQIMFTNSGTRNISLSMTNGNAYFAGNVSIGSTSSGSYDLYVNGKIGSNGINETSDIRFKKDIKPLEGSLDKLLQLNGVTYYWRHDEFPERKFEEGRDIGVIAQEVEKIFPELVKTDDQGYKAVEYSHLVPVLIEAVKEQQEIINSQKAELLASQKEAMLFQDQVNKKYEIEINSLYNKIEKLSASIEILNENQEMTKHE